MPNTQSSKRIAKVQMPMDMTRVRREGRQYVDMSKEPGMILIYEENRAPRIVSDQTIWDRMMSVECGGDTPGSMKSFFYFTVQNGRIVLGDLAPWQDW